jgi:sialic acid synthase SpsE
MNSRCYVIGEAGLNHNGSMDLAKSLIDLAAEAGADAVKFQKRNVATLAVGETLNAKDERFPSLGKTYREIRETLEFSFEQYQDLKCHAETRKIDFFCTAFDVPSTDFLEQLGVTKYKLASHSVTNLPLLRYLAGIGKPVIMSTGMCSWDELDTAVDIFKNAKAQLTLLHCVSAYPTQPEECNLRLIDTLRNRYAVPVGFSGHEIGYVPTLVAVGMGAVAVERHFTMSNTLEGFDHKMSLNPDNFKSMVAEIRRVEQMRGTGEKSVTEREMITRNKYHVSMASSRPIRKGEKLTEDMVNYRNPGTGIPVKEAMKVLGKTALADIPQDVLIRADMFEGSR